MTVALKLSEFDALNDAKKNGVREASPSLMLAEGSPRYFDKNGDPWVAYTDSRWTQLQIAKLAAMAENRDVLVGYDSPYVDDVTGEVKDRGAWASEIEALLQDDTAVNTTMTLPSNVSPSDPDADRPSFQDIRDAQESTDGSLDSVMRVNVDLSQWDRFEETV